jgi:hypothetical protein
MVPGVPRFQGFQRSGSSGDQPLIARVDQVIEHFDQRALGNPRETRELLVAEPAETFGNVARRRSGRVRELIAESILAPHIRPFEEHVDPTLDVV